MEIVFVDLPEVRRKVKQMESIGTVESIKAVSEIYSPISGEIIEVNKESSNIAGIHAAYKDVRAVTTYPILFSKMPK